MSISCQSAASLLPRFGTLESTGHSPLRTCYISVRSYTVSLHDEMSDPHGQSSSTSQPSPDPVDFAFYGMFLFISLLMRVLHPSPSVHTLELTCPGLSPTIQTGTSVPFPCHLPSLIPLGIPRSMLQPLSYFLGPCCCHAHVYQRGSANV